MMMQMGNSGQGMGAMGQNMAVMPQNMGMMGQNNMAAMGANMAGPMGGQATGYMGTGMQGNYGFEGFLGSIMMSAITVLFWALLIAGVVFLVRGLWEAYNTRQQTTVFSNSSLEILKQRFAKGEISREEFENIKEVLA